MNAELKELIELLKYRNSAGNKVQSIVISRDLFCMLISKTRMWIDKEREEILKEEGV